MSPSKEIDGEELEVLAAAMAIEEFGIEFYSRLEDCVSGDNGKALMRSLGRDEAKHKRMLVDLVSRLTGGKDVTEGNVDLAPFGIEPSKVFRSIPGDRCMTVSEELDALGIGIEVEKSSIKLYADAAEMATHKDVKERLLQLENIEKFHLRTLEDNVQQLKTEGTWYGYTPILEG